MKPILIKAVIALLCLGQCVEIDAQKRVSKIVESYLNGSSYPYELEYTADKLTKVTLYDAKNKEYAQNQTISYSDNEVIIEGVIDYVSNSKQTYTIDHNTGFATSCVFDSPDLGTINVEFEYTGGYLTKVSMTGDYYRGSSTMYITWENGNIISIADNAGNKNSATYKSEMTKTAQGIGLLSLDSEISQYYYSVYLAGLLGKPCFGLLDSITSGVYYTDKFFYQLDADGYILQQTMTTNGSTAVIVNYSYIDSAGIEEVSNSSTKLTVSNGNIILDGVDKGISIEVYSIGGKLVYKGTETTINVPTKGFYIVRVAGQTFKVIL